jgi:hypothetical protein
MRPPSPKIIGAKVDWRLGSSCRVPVKKGNLELRPQVYQKHTHKKNKFV